MDVVRVPSLELIVFVAIIESQFGTVVDGLSVTSLDATVVIQLGMKQRGLPIIRPQEGLWNLWFIFVPFIDYQLLPLCRVVVLDLDKRASTSM